jgi:hypothetical protein
VLRESPELVEWLADILTPQETAAVRLFLHVDP